MKKIVLAVFLGLLASSLSYAENNNFSADMISEIGGQTMSAKTYVSDQKVRTEIMGMIQITRLDRNVSYTLMPEQNMYMEQPIDPSAMAQAGGTIPGEVERVEMGSEQIEGRDTKRVRITYAANGQSHTMDQWIDGSGMIAKVASADGKWAMTYKNVELGAQPAELFEVPAGYQKMMMPAMPGGAGFNPQDFQDNE